MLSLLAPNRPYVKPVRPYFSLFFNLFFGKKFSPNSSFSEDLKKIGDEMLLTVFCSCFF